MTAATKDTAPGPPKVFALLARADGELVVGTVGRGVRHSANGWQDWAGPADDLFGVNTLTTGPDGRLLAGTVSRGVMASVDGGARWIDVGTGLENATVFAVLPCAGGLLAGTRDHGVAWLLRGTTNWQWLDDPAVPATVFRLVCVEDSVLAATESGVRSLRVPGARHAPISALTGGAVHALLSTPGGLVAGTAGDGLHRSADNGRTWQRVGEGVSDPVVHCLADNDRGTLLAGSGSGVAASTDGGATWRDSSVGLGGRRVFALLYAPGGRLVAGSYEGVWTSNSVGAEWQQLQTGLSVEAIFTVMTEASGTTVAGGFGSVWSSADDGESWTRSSDGLDGHAVHGIARAASGRRYLATDAGVMTERAPGSWSHIGLADCNVLSVASAGERLYAGTLGAGLWCSEDDGTTWARAAGFTCPTATHVVATSTAGVLATGLDARSGTKRGGVFRIDSSGGTSHRLAVPDIAAYRVAEGPDGRLYVGAQRSVVLRSDDKGAQWSTLATTGLVDCKVYALTVDRDGRVYLGTDAGVLCSDDYAVTWRPVGGLDAGSTPYSLVVTDTGTVIAGTSQGLRCAPASVPVGGLR